MKIYNKSLPRKEGTINVIFNEVDARCLINDLKDNTEISENTATLRNELMVFLSEVEDI